MCSNELLLYSPKCHREITDDKQPRLFCSSLCILLVRPLQTKYAFQHVILTLLRTVSPLQNRDSELSSAGCQIYIQSYLSLAQHLLAR
jgi:hypothetical protein